MRTHKKIRLHLPISQQVVSSSQQAKLVLLPKEIGIYLTQRSVTHRKP